MGCLIDMERKGCESKGCYTHSVTFNVSLTHDLDLGFSRSYFEKVVSQEWDGRLTWNERTVSWWDVTPTLWLSMSTLPMTLASDFQGQIFKNAVSEKWEGRLTWNKRDFSRQNVGPMLWLSMFTSSITLTLDFQGQILKKSYLRKGMADWHGTKGMWVHKMLDSHCDFRLWPHPWPWPWLFKVKYWNCCNVGMGGSTERDMSSVWCWMHNGIDLGPRCMANRSAK